MNELIDTQYLAGLTFRGAVTQRDGVKKITVPLERELTPADVLAWTETGTEVIVVAADGRKHVVSKGSAVDAPDAGDDSRPLSILPRDISPKGGRKK